MGGLNENIGSSILEIAERKSGIPRKPWNMKRYFFKKGSVFQHKKKPYCPPLLYKEKVCPRETKSNLI